MQYPKIKPDLDRRLKLLPEDRKNIKIKFKEGASIVELVEQYKVCYSTIRAVTDPAYREKRNKLSRERNKFKRATDPEWVKRHRKLTNESHRYKRTVMAKEERSYDTAQQYSWRIKNPIRYQELQERYKNKIKNQ